MNEVYDAAGNVVDPSSFTGPAFDLYGNAVSTMAQTNAANMAAANNYGAAATYSTATAPTTPSWLTQVLAAAPSVIQSGASIYASATAGKNQPKLPSLAQVKPSVAAPAQGGMSMTTILLLVGAGVLTLVLIIPRLMGSKK